MVAAIWRKHGKIRSRESDSPQAGFQVEAGNG
jgi:hypothetical protein